MGIELALEQAPPGHHGVGIIAPARPVRLAVLQQRLHVRRQGIVQAAFGAEAHSPVGRQRLSFSAREQVAHSLYPPRLGKDHPVEPAFLCRHEILADGLAEVLEFLGIGPGGFELHLRIERTHVEILLQAYASAPYRAVLPVAETDEVQVAGGIPQGGFHLLRRIPAALLHAAEALEHDGGDHGRGTHPLEPAESQIGIAAGQDLALEGILLRLIQAGSAKALRQHVGIERVGEREHVVGLGLNPLGHSLFQHAAYAYDGLFRIGAGHIDEEGAERIQQRLPVGTGQQHGGMGLGDGLHGLVHGYVHEHGIRAEGFIVRDEADEQPEIGDALRCVCIERHGRAAPRGDVHLDG